MVGVAQAFFYGLLALYIGVTTKEIYYLFHPPGCVGNMCYRAMLPPATRIDIFASVLAADDHPPIPLWNVTDASTDDAVDAKFELPIPPAVRTGDQSELWLLFELRRAGKEEAIAYARVNVVKFFEPKARSSATMLLERDADKEDERAVSAFAGDKGLAPTDARGRLPHFIYSYRSCELRLVADATAHHAPQYMGDGLPIGSHIHTRDRYYAPHFYVETFNLLRKHALPLSGNISRAHPMLRLKFKPISLGRHRMTRQVDGLFATISEVLSIDDELDELRELLSDERLFRFVVMQVGTLDAPPLALPPFSPQPICSRPDPLSPLSRRVCACVPSLPPRVPSRTSRVQIISFLHILFDVLAFKNDIGFWKGRETMSGLSSRAVLASAAQTLIIYLYLLDAEGVNQVVLFTYTVSTVLDLWKVVKVLGIMRAHRARQALHRQQREHQRDQQREQHQRRTDAKPPLLEAPTTEQPAAASDESAAAAAAAAASTSRRRGRAQNARRVEAATDRFDQVAMRVLYIGLGPLVAGWALYALLHQPHASWYSWLVSSLADSVYLFGFIGMTPQLFINYKLKSVAHMPWRVMSYKAFNTFVDDAFAILVSMPMHHKLACLRDDAVFVVFLVQRWLYPVDKRRANEYGLAYERDDDDEDDGGGGGDDGGGGGDDAGSAAEQPEPRALLDGGRGDDGGSGQ